MNSFFKLLSSLMIVCLALLSSCEKESLAVPAETSDFTPISFNEAISYNADGSYSYELTGAQMLYILSKETSDERPTDGSQLAEAFDHLILNKQSSKGKVDDLQKMTTFSLRYRVETILVQGDLIEDWVITGGGDGGLTPGATPSRTYQTRQSRRFGSFFLMAAYVNASDNTGAPAIPGDADSSADIFACTRFGKTSSIIGTSKINWNMDGTFTNVDANVRCNGDLTLPEGPGPIAPLPEPVE